MPRPLRLPPAPVPRSPGDQDVLAASSTSATFPDFTTRPPANSATRSAMRRACATSCVTITQVSSRSFTICRISASIPPFACSSSADVGSSSQQHDRLIRQRPRNRYALRLAARQCRDFALAVTAQPDAMQALFDLPSSQALRHADVGPKRTLSATVPGKRNACCVTIPIRRRSSRGESSR